MELSEYLKNSSVTLDIKSDKKEDIISELVNLLYEDKAIADKANILESVLDRESQMSTGLQSGIAMPHGRTSAIDKMVVAIGIKKDGVDFDALDGKPSKIFIMTISPVLQVDEYMEFLRAISNILMHSTVRNALLKAKNREELINIILKGGN